MIEIVFGEADTSCWKSSRYNDRVRVLIVPFDETFGVIVLTRSTTDYVRACGNARDKRTAHGTANIVRVPTACASVSQALTLM